MPKGVSNSNPGTRKAVQRMLQRHAPQISEIFNQTRKRESVCVCVCVCMHMCMCVSVHTHTHMFSKGHDVHMGRGNAFQGRVTYAGVIPGRGMFTGADHVDACRMSMEGGGIKMVKFG